MQILDGAAVSAHIKEQIRQEVVELKSDGKKVPHLAVIIVGNNPASESYVSNKVKSCGEVGFGSSLIRLDATISEEELLSVVNKLNEDKDVDGILVQLPLPKHIEENAVINAINPTKDVDGFHPISQGKMVLGLPTFLPATPYGIMLMLEHYNIDTVGKHCVVIGRSNIVGTPMTLLMSRNSNPGNATVTMCHSKTSNLKEICLQADIIVAAIGRPFFLKEDMVRDGGFGIIIIGN